MYLSPVPSIQSWGIFCFLPVAQTAAKRCLEVGGGENVLAKCQKDPLAQSVSNFLSNCRAGSCQKMKTKGN